MYIEIEDDVYNAFDDELKSKLKPYTPEDTTGLKDKANQILTEKKQLEAQLASTEAEIKQLKVAKPKDADAAKLQEQLDDAVSKIDDYKASYEKLQTQVVDEKRMSEALKIASELAPTNNKRASLLAEKIKDRIAIDNGNIVVLDANGNHTISSVNDLASSVKTEYDFLCDGSRASGGGAQGGSGGAANAKTVTRSEWNGFDHGKRAELAKSGTKVIDD